MPLTLDEQGALNSWIAAKIYWVVADTLGKPEANHYAREMQGAWERLNKMAVDVAQQTACPSIEHVTTYRTFQHCEVTCPSCGTVDCAAAKDAADQVFTRTQLRQQLKDMVVKAVLDCEKILWAVPTGESLLQQARDALVAFDKREASPKTNLS